ncbi:MAG: hypothetical protein PHY93_00675 [Bacteriovorax sp.]|nr:hypothetical protein [Bacteriovorax sp.]
MDRSIQELNNVKSFSTNCIHTKHIYSLLDLPKNDESYKRMNKHLENCTVCSKEFQKFQLKTAAAQVFIPKVLMDRDLRQSFEREVVELFKVMNLNDREILKRNVKKGFLFMDRMGIEFIQNLLSKTMFKAYFAAIVIFICLRLFL